MAVAMSSMPPDFLLYAANLFRRFPEEFLALGAPELDDVFDRDRAFRCRSEDMHQKRVSIKLPRRAAGFHASLPAARPSGVTHQAYNYHYQGMWQAAPCGMHTQTGFQQQMQSRSDIAMNSELGTVAPACQPRQADSSLGYPPHDGQNLVGWTHESQSLKASASSSSPREGQSLKGCLTQEGQSLKGCLTQEGQSLKTSASSSSLSAVVPVGRQKDLEQTRPEKLRLPDKVVRRKYSLSTAGGSDVDDNSVRSSQLKRRTSIEIGHYFQTPNRLRNNSVIILDWDDTLFPTSWILDHLRLNCSQPCPETYLKSMASLERQALELIDTARRLANTVAIVTLAQHSWVEKTSKNFCPALAAALEKHEIPVVYARDCVGDTSDEDFGIDGQGLFYTMKANAIAQVCAEEKPLLPAFGTGGVWGANVISIGDGKFELVGVQQATTEWSLKHHRTAERLPRTKTVKMLDEPTILDLEAQVRLITSWLETMVRCDTPFNLKLADAARLETSGRIVLDDEYVDSFMAAVGGEEFLDDALIEERVWKPKSDEDPKQAWHWLPRRIWLSRSGQLWYESMKQTKSAVLFGGLSIAHLKIRNGFPGEIVEEIQGIKVFGLVFQMPEDYQSELAKSSPRNSVQPVQYFAFESEEARKRCTTSFAAYTRLVGSGRIM